MRPGLAVQLFPEVFNSINAVTVTAEAAAGWPSAYAVSGKLSMPRLCASRPVWSGDSSVKRQAILWMLLLVQCNHATAVGCRLKYLFGLGLGCRDGQQFQWSLRSQMCSLSPCC